MLTKTKKNALRIITISTFMLLIIQSTGVFAQESSSDNHIAESHWVKYSWETTEAYIPYSASSIYVFIDDISNPDDIIINITRSDDGTNVLNESISAGYYVVNNNSLIQDWYNCPDNIGDPSAIRDNWAEPYLSNVTELFYDVEREAVLLEYEMDNYMLGGYEHNVSVSWLWDKKTGVLLNNTMDLDNLDEPALSGRIEHYLTETSLWSLDTGGGILGYSLPVMMATIVLFGLIVFARIRSKIRRLNK